jgi:hypothetical protein
MKFAIAVEGGEGFGKGLEEATASAGTRQPSLFDFTRKKKEAILSAWE